VGLLFSVAAVVSMLLRPLVGGWIATRRGARGFTPTGGGGMM
jgi:hypothetical protein